MNNQRQEQERRITEAWERHCQQVRYEIPYRAGAHVPLLAGQPVMGELGFRIAARELLDWMLAP